ncbi:MAG TPA: hypothetical protein DCG12_12685, partial [Planctomycetaceae bacterium]|nr:hypothetical protein [Planctomycetaceae bacterium]
MTEKSWNLNRRDLIRGSGLALSLPFLEGMLCGGESEQQMPKRMLVSYFAYGAYMPNGSNGIPSAKADHHEWSWWPCRDAG